MRMRKKKNLIPRMEACAGWLAAQPQTLRGGWRAAMGGEETAPLELEIGCGKGGFITELARREPGTCFVAAERVESVLLMALERAKAADLPNVRFVSEDAIRLGELFAPGEVSRIYLNFSDPWLPKRQHKRRLTWPTFLAVYDGILAQGGEICFKTDNRALFEDSICYFSQYGFGLHEVTFDLHATDTPNVTTEYERNFSQQGMPIYRLAARRRS